MRTLLLVWFALVPRLASAWDAEVPITNTNGDIYGEGIAATGTTVHLTYGENEVRYRSSLDQGATWGSDQRLDSGVLHLTDPIVADGNDVWIVYLKDIQNFTDWCCSRDGGNIYLLHSGTAGQTWDPPRQLTTSRAAFRVSLAFAAGRVHLVWMDYRNGSWDTYYLRSVDRGASWMPETRIAISAGTFGAERPQVAAEGERVHVTIWDDRGGNPPCTAGPNSFASCPDTFFIGSLDGGVTWGSEIAVAYSGAAFSGRNDIAVAGTRDVVINFNRAAPGTGDANPHLFAVHSGDNGATWDPAIQLTDTPGEADHGSIIGAGSDVHLAWHDSRGGALAIFYIHSADAGRTWQPEERVSTPTATDSSTPLVALTTGFVHVLWLDHRNGTYQVYYRRRALDVVPPPLVDAGINATNDAGASDPMAAPGGCGCQSSPSAASVWLISLVALVLRRRRR